MIYGCFAKAGDVVLVSVFLRKQYRHSIGFTQRGCRLRGPFCCVAEKAGVGEARSISAIWRGEPFAKNLLLFDNDFFGATS
jgi:hypothetical protein